MIVLINHGGAAACALLVHRFAYPAIEQKLPNLQIGISNGSSRTVEKLESGALLRSKSRKSCNSDGTLRGAKLLRAAQNATLTTKRHAHSHSAHSIIGPLPAETLPPVVPLAALPPLPEQARLWPSSSCLPKRLKRHSCFLTLLVWQRVNRFDNRLLHPTEIEQFETGVTSEKTSTIQIL